MNVRVVSIGIRIYLYIDDVIEFDNWLMNVNQKCSTNTDRYAIKSSNVFIWKFIYTSIYIVLIE